MASANAMLAGLTPERRYYAFSRFLKERFGLDKEADPVHVGLLTGAPLLFGCVACLVGGLLTDAFIRRTGNRKWGRRLFGLAGHGLCAVCYLGCLVAPSAFWFFAAISLAAFFNDMTMGSAWPASVKCASRAAGCSWS